MFGTQVAYRTGLTSCDRPASAADSQWPDGHARLRPGRTTSSRRLGSWRCTNPGFRSWPRADRGDPRPSNHRSAAAVLRSARRTGRASSRPGRHHFFTLRQADIKQPRRASGVMSSFAARAASLRWPALESFSCGRAFMADAERKTLPSRQNLPGQSRTTWRLALFQAAFTSRVLDNCPTMPRCCTTTSFEGVASGGSCESTWTIALVSFPTERPMSKPARRTCAKYRNPSTSSVRFRQGRLDFASGLRAKRGGGLTEGCGWLGPWCLRSGPPK